MLRVLFPYACNDEWTSHLPFSLVRHLSQTTLGAELWVASRGPRARRSFVHAALPAKLHALTRRLNHALAPRHDWVRAATEQRYKSALRGGDVALVSRGCSLELLQWLRARGHLVVLERVNVMGHTYSGIMADAHARAGWPMEFTLDQERLDAELAEVGLADFIFSASPAVSDSLLALHVPPHKILPCSYGWDPDRFKGLTRALPAIDGVTVLFVGSIGMRKGAHLLLRAWRKAGIHGRLVLLGPLEPQIARYCGDDLARSDVIHLPYDPNPAPVYRSADIFVLPTLEEGSPLVTYEAMGNGLPIVTSPMGAGWVVRHEQEGLVIDPYAEAAWIEALRRLAQDRATRGRLGDAGRLRAAEYTWDKVAQRRHEQLHDLVQARRTSPGQRSLAAARTPAN